MATKKQIRLEQEKAHSTYRRKALNACVALFFIVLTAVFPLYMNPEKYVALTMHKAYFFWAATLTATVAILLIFAWFHLAAFFRDYKTAEAGKITVSVYEWALIAFLLLAFISAIISRYQQIVWMGVPEPGGRYEGFLTYLCYCLVFLIIVRLYIPKNWHLYVFAGSAIAVAAIGILQFADMDIFDLYPYYNWTTIDEYGNPMYGGLSISFRTTLGNVNVVSAYVALTVTMFAALYAGSQSRWRFIYLAATATNFCLLMIEGSDAGRVGILATMVLLLPYWLAERKRLGRIIIALASWSAMYALYLGYLQYRVNINQVNPTDRLHDARELDRLASQGVQEMWPYLLLAAVLLVIGVALIYLLTKVRWPNAAPVIGLVLIGVMLIGGLIGIEVLGSRLSDQPGNIIFQAREVLHGRMEDNFGSNRGWIWKKGFSIIPKYWLVGSGPDTFYYALGENLQSEYKALAGVVVDKAHNHFLQIAVTLGVPALLCYLVFLSRIFILAAKKAFNSPLLLAAGAGSVAYVVQAFFSVDVPIVSPLYWAILGLMVSEMRAMDIRDSLAGQNG